MTIHQYVPLIHLQLAPEPDYLFTVVKAGALIQPVSEPNTANYVRLENYQRIEDEWPFPRGTQCWTVSKDSINGWTIGWLQHRFPQQQILFVRFPVSREGYLGFLANIYSLF